MLSEPNNRCDSCKRDYSNAILREIDVFQVNTPLRKSSHQSIGHGANTLIAEILGRHLQVEHMKSDVTSSAAAAASTPLASLLCRLCCILGSAICFLLHIPSDDLPEGDARVAAVGVVKPVALPHNERVGAAIAVREADPGSGVGCPGECVWPGATGACFLLCLSSAGDGGGESVESGAQMVLCHWTARANALLLKSRCLKVEGW